MADYTAPPTVEALKAMWMAAVPTAGPSERYDRAVNFDVWASTTSGAFIEALEAIADSALSEPTGMAPFNSYESGWEAGYLSKGSSIAGEIRDLIAKIKGE